MSGNPYRQVFPSELFAMEIDVELGNVFQKVMQYRNKGQREMVSWIWRRAPMVVVARG
jgi:hypothetical protein